MNDSTAEWNRPFGERLAEVAEERATDPMATEDPTDLSEAERLGTEHGTAAGSWVVDGNSSTETLRAVIAASDEGEFWNDIAPDMSGPLSGEWGGDYLAWQLAEDLGVDEESDNFPDLCRAYEDAWFSAYEDEAVRSAKAMLPDEPRCGHSRDAVCDGQHGTNVGPGASAAE